MKEVVYIVISRIGQQEREHQWEHWKLQNIARKVPQGHHQWR